MFCFLSFFRLLLAPLCSVFPKESLFWGGGAPSLLATCTCCFVPQAETTHLTVVVEKRALTHNLSVLSWHTGMWVSPSCMLVLLRLLCACSAAVLCSAAGTPFAQAPPSHSAAPPPQHPVQTEPAPSPGLPLTSVARTQMTAQAHKIGKTGFVLHNNTKKKENK